jgi:hypothetical protein
MMSVLRRCCARGVSCVCAIDHRHNPDDIECNERTPTAGAYSVNRADTGVLEDQVLPPD